jgi:hypothetical protein
MWNGRVTTCSSVAGYDKKPFARHVSDCVAECGVGWLSYITTTVLGTKLIHSPWYCLSLIIIMILLK